MIPLLNLSSLLLKDTLVILAIQNIQLQANISVTECVFPIMIAKKEQTIIFVIKFKKNIMLVVLLLNIPNFGISHSIRLHTIDMHWYCQEYNYG